MFRLDWFGLSEGAAADHRGMLTLVGFNPQVLAIPLEAMPASVGLVLVVVLESDDPERPGDHALGYSVRLTAPDGSILFAAQQTAPLPVRIHPELPIRVQIVLGTQVALRLHGRYEAAVTIEFPDQAPIYGTRSIYVMSPVELGPEATTSAPP